MRRARWLLLAAIAAILVTVGATYIKRRERISNAAPALPALLEQGTEGRANGWVYTQSDGDRPRVTVRAQSFRQIKEPSVMELNGVELQIYHANGRDFDRVKSARAEFDVAGRSLYSEGAVDIVMGVNEDTPEHARLLRIQTSGVRFASDTGKAVTDKPATFEFGQGSGSAVGAEYDPQNRELHLKSAVALNWRSPRPDAPPVHVVAGDALYREREAKVLLQPWSKLTRGNLRLDAGLSIVTLEKGLIQDAAAQQARGTLDDPQRKIDFAADDLDLAFGEAMTIKVIQGQRNARLVSTAAASRTTITADRIDLAFTTTGKESELQGAVAAGKSLAEAAPLSRSGTDVPETRTLRSEIIRLSMREGGREIEQVVTDGAATLEFLPNRPTQARRWLKGDRVWIDYGPDNRIRSFRSMNVETRTDRPRQASQPAPAPVFTQSKEIVATFDPATSQMLRAEQKTDFRYQEGDRRAQSDRATLDQMSEVITLDGAARFWDPTGSAQGDRIVLEQKSGDYTVEGHVATSRQPDRKGPSSAMLSNDEIMQARSQKLVSKDQNQRLHYEGNAVAWQGANRITADRIDIDRVRRLLEAHGNVTTQLADKTPAEEASKGKAKAPAAPVFTVVHALDLEYTEETRLAWYRGGVSLVRPQLTVNSRELRAFLKDSGSDTALDKAFADGAVKIVSVFADPKVRRTRTGLSEHAEYYPEDQKLILEGGQPQLIDSEKGKTTGKQLTWFASNDRLLVDGEEQKPAVTTLRKK
jgi:lipopolysaccharide export system protein LptA